MKVGAGVFPHPPFAKSIARVLNWGLASTLYPQTCRDRRPRLSVVPHNHPLHASWCDNTNGMLVVDRGQSRTPVPTRFARCIIVGRGSWAIRRKHKQISLFSGRRGRRPLQYRRNVGRGSRAIRESPLRGGGTWECWSRMRLKSLVATAS